MGFPETEDVINGFHPVGPFLFVACVPWPRVLSSCLHPISPVVPDSGLLFGC